MLIESCILDSDPVLEALPARKALLRIVYLLIGLGLDFTPTESHFERYHNSISTEVCGHQSRAPERSSALKLRNKAL
jgi:hypothetical protein